MLRKGPTCRETARTVHCWPRKRLSAFVLRTPWHTSSHTQSYTKHIIVGALSRLLLSKSRLSCHRFFSAASAGLPISLWPRCIASSNVSPFLFAPIHTHSQCMYAARRWTMPLRQPANLARARRCHCRHPVTTTKDCWRRHHADCRRNLARYRRAGQVLLCPIRHS